MLPAMTFWTISASDWFTIQMPPPCPVPTLLRTITLLRITGTPAANTEMPPPLAWVRLLSAMTFPSINAALAPPSLMPAPPTPPEQPLRTSCEISLFAIRGERKCTWIPMPSQPLLPVITFDSMVGDAFEMAMPPPLKADPLVTVKPRSTAARPSPELKVTTVPPRAPSMIVTAGPPSLTTVTAFPRKFRRSGYVPGATATVSPFRVTLMAAWMVGWSAGTRMVIWAVAVLTDRPTTSSARANTLEGIRIPLYWWLVESDRIAVAEQRVCHGLARGRSDA